LFNKNRDKNFRNLPFFGRLSGVFMDFGAHFYGGYRIKSPWPQGTGLPSYSIFALRCLAENISNIFENSYTP
jgi:hypothetical protein